MILFIFEGKKTEPNLFKTIEKLYFQNTEEQKICCFGYNIYELYKLMNESDFTENVISVIRTKMASRNDHSIPEDADISDFSEVFLFFDYDFQNKNLPLEELNKQVREMLDFFSNETENGKLYINYPMVESIKCTNQLPDSNYYTYTVTRKDCHDFKDYVTKTYNYYKSTDYFIFSIDSKTKTLRPFTPEKEKLISESWKHLNKQNICKANFICKDINELPESKNDINQTNLFENQITKYVTNNETVSILNSFPLFLYEYFKEIF